MDHPGTRNESSTSNHVDKSTTGGMPIASSTSRSPDMRPLMTNASERVLKKPQKLADLVSSGGTRSPSNPSNETGQLGSPELVRMQTL